MVMSLIACPAPKREATSFAVAIRNCGSDEVTEAAIQFDGFSGVMGILPPGVEKTQGFIEASIPETAEVVWRDRTAAMRKKVIPVRNALPADFSHDEMVFEICPDGEVKLRAQASPAANVRLPGTWRDRAKGGCCSEP